MEISLEELLSCEFFVRSKILAGKNGIENIITHVTTLDSPDAYHYFKGGEFVITTGYSFLNDLTYQKELIKRLVDKGVAGMGIKLRYFNNELPKYIREQADELNFPIISLPNEDSYTDIYEFITSNFVAKTTRDIGTLNEVYKEIGESLFNYGFLGVAKSLYKWTGLQVVIGINNHIYTYPEDSMLEYFPMNTNLWRKKIFQNKTNVNIDSYCWESNDRYLEWICSEIIYDKNVEGYVLLLKKDKYKYISKDTCLLLDYSRIACQFEIRRIKTIEDMQRRYKREFLQSLIFKKVSLAEIERQAMILNYHLLDEGIIILIRGIEEKYLDKVVSKVYSPHTISGMLEDDLAVIYVEPSEQYVSDINRFYDECEKNFNLENVVIGVGTPTKLDEIEKSYAEGNRALEIGQCLHNKPNINYFSHMGFYQLLKISNTTDEIKNYCEKYIKPLENQGEENYKNSIKTIECFIKNAYNFKETAEELSVHPNTVRYRIALVEKLCNINFKYAEDRLNMEVALKILPLVD